MKPLPPELSPQRVEPTRANALAQARALLDDAAAPGARCAFFTATVDADAWTAISGSGDAGQMLRVATAMLSAIEDAQAAHGDAGLSARCAEARRVLGVVGEVSTGGARPYRDGDGA